MSLLIAVLDLFRGRRCIPVRALQRLFALPLFDARHELVDDGANFRHDAIIDHRPLAPSQHRKTSLDYQEPELVLIVELSHTYNIQHRL
jgi:hypothetical protein